MWLDLGGWGGERSEQCLRLDRCRVVEGRGREENVPGTEDSVEYRLGGTGRMDEAGAAGRSQSGCREAGKAV